jgi:hypothetical protein
MYGNFDTKIVSKYFYLFYIVFKNVVCNEDECCKLAQKLALCMPLISSGFFITYLEKQAITKEPENLYEPYLYIGVRGKRIRPVLNINDY